jgi:hypothetical protein
MANEHPERDFFSKERDISRPTIQIFSEETEENIRGIDWYRAALQGHLVAKSYPRTRTSEVTFDWESHTGPSAAISMLNWDRALFDYLRRDHLFHQTGLQLGRALVAQSDAEVDRISTGREGSYAKLALARGSYVTDLRPRVSRSPDNGIALQSSTDKGTLNLIIEGDQAILIRASDDFAVQVNCNLNPTSISELLDIYELELNRIACR